jgi:pilus assembly protein CpaB
MSMRQIIVLGFALLAAVAALFLVRGMAVKAPAPKAADVVVTNGVPVLVAARPLEQGDSAAPGDLAWANFPPETMSENFIQQSADPKAMDEFAGAVARFKMEKGEPITATKLVKKGEQGFMAAMLTPGYRAVAVPITDETAAAGFILPNDKVDVIVTRRIEVSNGGEGGGNHDDVRSDIVLEGVRVLAIDGNYRAPVQDKEPKQMTGAVATLELTPRDAETLSMADKMGDIALALRGVENEPGDAKVASAGRGMGRDGGGLGSVRIHSFGSVKDAAVQASGAGATP